MLPMESCAADQTVIARKLPSLAPPDGIALSRGAGTSPMIVQTKSPSHREDISLVRDSSIPTRNGESTISSVVAESPASGHFARGQSRPRSHSALGRRAELATRSWRPPPSPSELPADSALLAVGGPRARRLGAGAGAPGRRRLPRPGRAREDSALLVHCCAKPGRARTGPGLPGPSAQGHRNATEGRSLREAGAWLRPGASPFELQLAPVPVDLPCSWNRPRTTTAGAAGGPHGPA